MATIKADTNEVPAPIPRRTTSPNSLQQLLTVKQVAELDHCSEKTVRRAIQAGLLSALRVGPGSRLLRISKAAHEAYRRGGVL